MELVEARILISLVKLLAPSSEYLSTLTLKLSVSPALIATTNKHANWSLKTDSDGWYWNGPPIHLFIP